jgi:hypothetical protein
MAELETMNLHGFLELLEDWEECAAAREANFCSANDPARLAVRVIRDGG